MLVHQRVKTSDYRGKKNKKGLEMQSIVGASFFALYVFI
jgi:hypothetical protein